MIELAIAKAANPGLADLTITFTEPAPQFKSLEYAAKFYDIQAEQLSHALLNVLPGGIVDRLLGCMLARRASLFRVALFTDEEGG